MFLDVSLVFDWLFCLLEGLLDFLLLVVLGVVSSVFEAVFLAPLLLEDPDFLFSSSTLAVNKKLTCILLSGTQ